MLRKIYFSIVTLLLAGASVIAQNTAGSIKVLLKDKSNGESIPFANVVAYQGGVQVGVGTTDMDGYAVIKPLSPGKYDVKGVYVGYQPQEMKGINVSESKTTYITISLENGDGVKLDEVMVIEYQEPLIDPDTKSGGTVTREEYQNMATKNINSVAATTAGVYQADEGGALNVRGGRSDNTTYFVDGVKVIGGLGVPQQGVEQLQVITGGLPAQYGDATSGVISVTTRGPQSKFFGGVELVSSQLTDKYGYNSLGFSIGGPVLQKKDSAGNKTPIIGFFLSGQGTYEKDPSPSAVPIYKLTDAKLKEVEETPLKLAPSGQGFYRALDFVTKDDMTTTKVRQNVASRSVQLNGKLDFKLTPSTNLTLGGAFDYGNKHNYTYEYSLFNSQNNPQIISTTWRTFARINQKFGTNQTGAEKEKSQNIISNAYFTFLASYEKSKFKRQDDSHKDKLFNYGYIGKFNYGVDTGSTRYVHLNAGTDSAYWAYSGRGLTPVTFERSEVNATGANYTSQVFDYYGTLPTINAIQSNYGFVNGDRPQNINSLYSSTGRQYNDYSNYDRSQIRFSSSFSADIKNHALMVGVEYDQRNESGYSVNPIGLWTRMRQITNTHLKTLDAKNAILVPELSGTENYYYSNYIYNEADQSQFDKSIREKLGLAKNNQTYINTDALNPDDLSLSMFSAEDLIYKGVTGEQLVTYYGYDYLGNKDNNSTNLDKFLNDRDSKGNLKLNVGGYKPIYVAGYIQDKFDYKDIKFNVGVRVDRFDANQKVLKDPYLFQEAYTAGEKSPDKPSNIKDDYVVYVDNIKSSNPNIIGYRHTDEKTSTTTWYNSEGKEISDPSVLANLSSDGKVTPYLKDPSFAEKNAFSVNAFKDYKPQINIMPRIAFSFPISDVANFFAHYDVLTQRPTGSNDPYGTGSNAPLDMRFNPLDYYYIGSTSSNPFITNSNLKPSKTIDYELGYNQVLNQKKNAALKITAFYREMRNQITIVTLNQAYPKTYQTYANKDFGTTKGLSLEFDLRRTNGISLTANYTLQFADGSGSNAQSGANLANSGQPNLRVTLPMDYDQRHNFVLTLDYRFGEGKDYKGPQFNRKKKDKTQTVQLLQNMGANLSFLVGSGTPYTRYIGAVPNGPTPGKSSILGSLNGSSKPWQFRANLRVDKNIELSWGKKDSDKHKTANLNIYLQVLNLLNNKNIQNVYSYTGNPGDDGYLVSPTGVVNTNSNVSPAAFTDQYNIYLNKSSNYSRPRTIRIGVLLDF
jgi:hypothetical protein